MADAIIAEKQCCICKNVLPVSCFSKGKARKDGLAANCKTCQAEYTKRWRATNAEKIKADKKAEYEAKREHYIAKAKEWRDANPERKRENDLRWRTENYERKRENDRRWREQAGESRLIQKRQYQQANKEKIAEKNRLARLADPERTKQKDKERYQRTRDAVLAKRRQAYADNENGYRDRWREYRRGRADKIREYRIRYSASKVALDDSYRLSRRMSEGIRKSLKAGKGGAAWLSLVPYTLKQLKARLLKTMPDGYTWDDFLSGRLHVDHILPVSKFNITSHSDIDFQRCWSLSNLQLLPAHQNISKHNKIEKPMQPSFSGI